MADKILLDCGSGGSASHRLISGLFLKHLGNPELNRLNDAAVLALSACGTGKLAVSTDSFVVDPIFFPGGDIGSLAVNGTVNDVAMMGARPLWLTCGFIIEEGLPMADLERIVASVAESCAKAGVSVVTGDTKVVPRGAVDKIFINTTGIGEVLREPTPSGDRARPGDAVLISGAIGDHGLAILSTRQGLSFEAPVVSDCAALNHMIGTLLEAIPDIHVLRDPTRGGVATTLNEIAQSSQVGCLIEEGDLPIRPEVAGGCSFLGLDPLYLANEGKLLCVLPGEFADQALSIMRADPLGAGAMRIGTMEAENPGKVILRTGLGGKRLLNMLEGEQLPRIC